MEKIKKYNLSAELANLPGQEQQPGQRQHQPEQQAPAGPEDWEKQADQEAKNRNQEKELYHRLRQQKNQPPAYRKKKYR